MDDEREESGSEVDSEKTPGQVKDKCQVKMRREWEMYMNLSWNLYESESRLCRAGAKLRPKAVEMTTQQLSDLLRVRKVPRY